MPRFAILLFWSALLFALVMALMPLPPQLPGAPSDKVQHVIAFLVLAGLGRWAYPHAGLLMLLIALSAFGALIEVAQSIPGLNRDADIVDWVADTVATVIGLAIMSVLFRTGRRSV